MTSPFTDAGSAKSDESSEPQVPNNLVVDKLKRKLHRRQHLIPSSIRLNNIPLK